MKRGGWGIARGEALELSKCLTKHMHWFCFGIFVEFMCCACFIFRKDIFHEKKDRTGGAKESEKRKKHRQKRTKIRFYFCVKMIPLKDGGGVPSNLQLTSIFKLVIRLLKYLMFKLCNYLTIFVSGQVRGN